MGMQAEPLFACPHDTGAYTAWILILYVQYVINATPMPYIQQFKIWDTRAQV